MIYFSFRFLLCNAIICIFLGSLLGLKNLLQRQLSASYRRVQGRQTLRPALHNGRVRQGGGAGMPPRGNQTRLAGEDPNLAPVPRRQIASVSRDQLEIGSLTGLGCDTSRDER